jgi:hypothetical protein
MVAIRAREVLELYATVALPCNRTGTIRNIAYLHQLFRLDELGARVLLPQALSTSRDPSLFQLPPYVLNVGNFYEVDSVATASYSPNSGGVAATASAATVTTVVVVESGEVVARLQGGSSRTISASSSLLLNASLSYDEDVSPTDQALGQNLSYLWTCRIVSVAQYGDDCMSVLGTAVLTSATLTLHGASLNSLRTYFFQVLVSADSAGNVRSDSIAVTVKVLQQSTALPFRAAANSSIDSLRVKFNRGDALNIFATIGGNVDSSTEWTARAGGVAVDLQNRVESPLRGTFTSQEMAGTAQFPLSVMAHQFSAGSVVTFRLDVRYWAVNGLAVELVELSSCEIHLTVNAPPSSGVLVASTKEGGRTEGYSLADVFTLQTHSWSDDLDDYPLTYAFVYERQLLFPPSTVQERGPLTFVDTLLAHGVETNQYRLLLMVRAFDTYLAEGLTNAIVTVRPNISLGSIDATTSIYLEDSVLLGQLLGQTSYAVQAINNVANI